MRWEHYELHHCQCKPQLERCAKSCAIETVNRKLRRSRVQRFQSSLKSHWSAEVNLHKFHVRRNVARSQNHQQALHQFRKKTRAQSKHQWRDTILQTDWRSNLWLFNPLLLFWFTLEVFFLLSCKLNSFPARLCFLQPLNNSCTAIFIVRNPLSV